jgi:hypothetical protein
VVAICVEKGLHELRQKAGGRYRHAALLCSIGSPQVDYKEGSAEAELPTHLSLVVATLVADWCRISIEPRFDWKMEQG